MSTAALNDIGVALQSVLYYVAACSTIRKCAHRRRRQKEAVRARTEKAQIEMEQPGLYDHPLPFATNPHWEEEMRLGPGPPRRDRRKAEKPESKWAKMRSGTEHMLEGGISDLPAEEEVDRIDTQSTIETEEVEGWNRSRYQREDEELWGHDVNHPARVENAIGHPRSFAKGSTIGLVGASRAPGDRTEKYHYTVRCPPVNELHPPVVSSPPTNGGQMKWMLQPPPNAKIMEGKQRANRSRAGTGGSSQKEAALSKRSAQGSISRKRQSSSQRSRRSRATQRETGVYDFGDELVDGSSEASYKKRRPPPIPISEDRRSSSTPPRHASSDARPPLKTLASSPLVVNASNASAMYATHIQSKPFRDLLTPSNVLNSKTVGDGRRQSNHDREGSVVSVAKDEVSVPTLESLFPYTFRFPDPEIERGDVLRQRWSMDI